MRALRSVPLVVLAASWLPAGSATPPPSERAVGPECAERAGATVTQLPDVVVPAVVVAPVTTPDVDVGGVAVPGLTVAGFTIPEEVVDAGCVIAYDAPGGCLGAVEITGTAIPDVVIPASVIPAVELPTGEIVAEQTVAAVTISGATTGPVRTEQVCQIEIDGELPTVSRAGVVRAEISRPGGARPGVTRPERCFDSGCVPAVRVEAVRLDPVQLPDVDVDPVRLQSHELEADVAVLTGNGEASFVAPGDVLFDTDQATILPAAADALGVIAERLAATAPGSPITIEGHTDDRGTEEHNLDLSQRRAQAVTEWLVANAGIDPGRITVVGLGESAPAYPNDDAANRQLNRRVVVSVAEA